MKTEAQAIRQHTRARNGQYSNGLTCDLCGKPVHSTDYYSDRRTDTTTVIDGKEIHWGDSAMTLHRRCAATLDRMDDKTAYEAVRKIR